MLWLALANGPLIHLFWKKDKARLSLDLAGPKLSDRGYRRERAILGRRTKQVEARLGKSLSRSSRGIQEV